MVVFGITVGIHLKYPVHLITLSIHLWLMCTPQQYIHIILHVPLSTNNNYISPF